MGGRAAWVGRHLENVGGIAFTGYGVYKVVFVVWVGRGNVTVQRGLMGGKCRASNGKACQQPDPDGGMGFELGHGVSLHEPGESGKSRDSTCSPRAFRHICVLEVYVHDQSAGGRRPWSGAQCATVPTPNRRRNRGS